MHETNRLKILSVSYDTLTALLTSELRLWRIVGMPKDATIVGVNVEYHFSSNMFQLKIHSASFPIAEPGERLPELKLTIEWSMRKNVEERCTID